MNGGLGAGGLSVSNTATGDALAAAAVAFVESGMLVGIGAGRTAARGLRALGRRVREERLDVRVAPATDRIEQVARESGLKTVDFSTVEQLDLLIDGADEVDRELRMLKGSRGAVARERVLAWASDRRVYTVDESKVSERIGTNATLCVAVLAFGLTASRAAMRDIGLNGVVRRDLNGELFVNDNGNLIVDVRLPADQDLERLAAELTAIPGVVDHGLFLREADVLLIGSEEGPVERLVRGESAMASVGS